MPTAVIVHNHPIHYKNLLFQELQRRGLSFEVLFVASGSVNRLEAPSGGYPYRWGYRDRTRRRPRPRSQGSSGPRSARSIRGSLSSAATTTLPPGRRGRGQNCTAARSSFGPNPIASTTRAGAGKSRSRPPSSAAAPRPTSTARPIASTCAIWGCQTAGSPPSAP